MLKKQDFWMLTGLLIWLGIYLWSGATTFQPADSAEFLTVSAQGGVAHPPGYPLYVLLGWLTTHSLPFSVPRALAVLSAVLTCGTLLGIYATLCVLVRDRLVACLGMMATGVSLHLWKHATHPEAFALLGFFAAWLCFFTCVATLRSTSDRWRTYAWWGYALCAGLASAHHHTIVFTCPLGFWLLWSVFGSSETRIAQRARVWWIGCGFFLLGLLPYIQLLAWGGMDAPFGSWGEIVSFSDMWSHMIREEFGTFASGVYQSDRPFAFHSLRYWKRLLSWTGSFPLGLSLWGVVGVVSMLWVAKQTWNTSEHTLQDVESDESIPLGLYIALFLSWILTGAVFPSLLLMGTSHLDQYVAARFFLLPDVFAGLFIGIGMGWALYKLQIRSSLGSTLGWSLLMLWIVASGWMQIGHASSRHRNWLETYTLDLLREQPPRARLIEAADEAICFGVTYLQEVRKIRTDVQFICVPMLGRKWYAKRLNARWPTLRYRWHSKRISSLSVIASALQEKRPVHVTTLYNRSMRRYVQWVPFGLSWRAVPPNQRPPHPTHVMQQLSKRFRALKSQHPLPDPVDAPWPANVLHRYTNPWTALAGVFKRMRNEKAAAQCVQEAQKWNIVRK